MNLRLLAFLIWIVFCIATAATLPPLSALAMISIISFLALGLRWLCRTLLQVPSTARRGHATESMHQENY